VIERCGHAPQLERPTELAGIFKEFLGASAA
jgi:pimeloyl-ACP methyl ester carboxylesterase